MLAAGPGLACMEGEAPLASLTDMPPTILHLLGCSVPEHMDGHVLATHLAPEWGARSIDTHVERDWAGRQKEDGLSPEEEEELLARLRNLGYVE